MFKIVKTEGDKEVTGETITNSIGNSGSAITLNDDLDVNSNDVSNVTTLGATTGNITTVNSDTGNIDIVVSDSVNLTPGTEPTANNSLWVDSGDSNKFKFKDNSGNSYSVNSDIANGYILIESMYPDPSDPPGNSLVGINPSVDFDPTSDEIAYFSFQTPSDLDTSADILFEIAYCMSSANTSANVVIGLDSNAIADGEDSTPTVESTTTETIAVPDTLEQMDIVTTTTAKIPASILSGTQVISVRFYRDANNASDTANGDFQLLNIRAKYTRT